jgi:hypothetical protein
LAYRKIADVSEIFQIRTVFRVEIETQKVMTEIKRAKIVPKPFVLQKPTTMFKNK